jgi:hypothetical protein
MLENIHNDPLELLGGNAYVLLVYVRADVMNMVCCNSYNFSTYKFGSDL